MGKIHDVLSKIKSPEARAAKPARFGVTLASTGEPRASLDPPRRGAAPHGVKGDGEINNEADLLREVAKADAELGLPPATRWPTTTYPAGSSTARASLVRESRRPAGPGLVGLTIQRRESMARQASGDFYEWMVHNE